jgi:hypothetical protein
MRSAEGAWPAGVKVNQAPGGGGQRCDSEGSDQRRASGKRMKGPKMREWK